MKIIAYVSFVKRKKIKKEDSCLIINPYWIELLFYYNYDKIFLTSFKIHTKTKSNNLIALHNLLLLNNDIDNVVYFFNNYHNIEFKKFIITIHCDIEYISKIMKIDIETIKKFNNNKIKFKKGSEIILTII